MPPCRYRPLYLLLPSHLPIESFHFTGEELSCRLSAATDHWLAASRELFARTNGYSIDQDRSTKCISQLSDTCSAWKHQTWLSSFLAVRLSSTFCGGLQAAVPSTIVSTNLRLDSSARLTDVPLPRSSHELSTSDTFHLHDSFNDTDSSEPWSRWSTPHSTAASLIPTCESRFQQDETRSRPRQRASLDVRGTLRRLSELSSLISGASNGAAATRMFGGIHRGSTRVGQFRRLRPMRVGQRHRWIEIVFVVLAWSASEHNWSGRTTQLVEGPCPVRIQFLDYTVQALPLPSSGFSPQRYTPWLSWTLAGASMSYSGDGRLVWQGRKEGKESGRGQMEESR